MPAVYVACCLVGNQDIFAVLFDSAQSTVFCNKRYTLVFKNLTSYYNIACWVIGN